MQIPYFLPPLGEGLPRLNPLLYLIDGFRHAILGVGDTSLETAFAVSAAIALALFAWASLLIGSKLRT